VPALPPLGVGLGRLLPHAEPHDTTHDTRHEEVRREDEQSKVIRLFVLSNQ
jgi:hypothetical protein